MTTVTQKHELAPAKTASHLTFCLHPWSPAPSSESVASLPWAAVVFFEVYNVIGGSKRFPHRSFNKNEKEHHCSEDGCLQHRIWNCWNFMGSLRTPPNLGFILCNFCAPRLGDAKYDSYIYIYIPAIWLASSLFYTWISQKKYCKLGTQR